MSPPSFFQDHQGNFRISDRIKPGCTMCPRRRKKRDEELPECDNCARRRFECEGNMNQPHKRFSKCPFSIRRLNSTTHLIREDDSYGEWPNIYAKLVTVDLDIPGGHLSRSLLVLSDTGCGTEVLNPGYSASVPDMGPEKWNLRTFLEFTLNRGERIPYLVMTTHCHYDHILGIGFLPATCVGACCRVRGKGGQDDVSEHPRASRNTPPTTVLSSSHNPSFITPYAHLVAHSLCEAVHRPAPHYAVGIWAHDGQRIIFMYSDDETKLVRIDTGITILHTPGHTPDSLTWYDNGERHISVGDSLYEQESPDSKGETGERNWGREPAMPTIFNNESNLADWWESLKKVIEFVREENKKTKQVVEQERGPEVEDILQDVNENGGWSDDDSGWMLVQPHQFNYTGRESEQGLMEPISTHSATNGRRIRPKLKRRVILSAAHVTAEVDAEECLLEMKDFVARILRDEVPFHELEKRESGKKVGFWDDLLDEEKDVRTGANRGRFSVQSPLWIIERGREKIAKDEWDRA